MEARLGGPSVLCLPSGPAPPASPSSPAVPCQAPACQRARLSLPSGLFERTGRFRVSQGGFQSPLGRPGSGYTREACPEAAGGSLEGSPPDTKDWSSFYGPRKLELFFCPIYKIILNWLQTNKRKGGHILVLTFAGFAEHVPGACCTRGPGHRHHDADTASSAALPALPRGSPCTPGSLRPRTRLGVPGRCTPGSLHLRVRLGVPRRQLWPRVSLQLVIHVTAHVLSFCASCSPVLSLPHAPLQLLPPVLTKKLSDTK